MSSQKVGRETRYQLNAAPLWKIEDGVSLQEVLERKDNAFKSNSTGGTKNGRTFTRFSNQRFNQAGVVCFNRLGYSGQVDNDFKPVVGHKFQFRTEPTPWMNGIIDCEVLKVDEPHQLSYTWVSGSENNTVIWTLNETTDGTTNLHLQQTGISGGEQVIQGAKYGWKKTCSQLEKVLSKQ